MPDYRIKISETTDEDVENHHYLVTAKDEKEARKIRHALYGAFH